MVEKLKLVLSGPRFRLLAKSIIFGLALAFAKINDFGWFSVVVFLAVTSFLYFRQGFHSLRAQNLFSFLALLSVSLGIISVLHRWFFVFSATAFFSFLFYLLIGVKELVFVSRRNWNFVKNILLIYSIFALFFYSDKSSFFVVKYLATLVAVFLIFKEVFYWVDNYFPKRCTLAALVSTFVVGEILWAAALLPIGLISLANVMTIFFFILANLSVAHFNGNMTKRSVVVNMSVFFALLTLVFLASRWVVSY